MKKTPFLLSLSLLACGFLVCSCTEPSKPAATGPGGVPQYTQGHWMIVALDQQVHLTDAQKQRANQLDQRYASALRELQTKAGRDLTAELTPRQRAQFAKKYGQLGAWMPNPMIVPLIDREVDLSGEQKERMNLVVQESTARIQDRQTRFNNELVAILTPEQRDQYTHAQVYNGVWNRIACVHPTTEQQAKFKAIMDELVKSVNLADQKTREALTLKIYFYVRDNVLTEDQLKFFKFYPNAFYPDKPDMKPVRPELKT